MVPAVKANKLKAQLIGYVMIVETSSKPKTLSYKKWIWWMEVGRRLGCHQMACRSFFVKGYQFPICARCTGVTVGLVVAVVLFFFYRLPLWVSVACCAVMLGDWLLQYFDIKESNNIRRFITGVLGGVGTTTIQLELYLFIIKLFSKAF